MFIKVNGEYMLTDTAYSVGKKLVQVVLPAVSSLYFGLAAIWGLPSSEQVVGTLAILATFLGICLNVSSRHYDSSDAAYDGNVVVNEPVAGVMNYSLELDGDPADIVNKDSITFKVRNDI